jgi:hypothetical protein
MQCKSRSRASNPDSFTLTYPVPIRTASCAGIKDEPDPDTYFDFPVE